ncbi:hypothetical protein GZH47_02015 [Paenibacillus rhizovicinus]|uniref:Uncharacterized protein n=1 Tax=Paenibacillus rhizovicinus TaxID=2704463 RepID=A0A6C0NVG4_9BACL|nr:hypothetical protein [Paenibacillus rhizovicinus]QHW29733.1 hypothetical protein GZH47_02015 [Paenibacillus rhizovicinus]
MPNYMPYLLLAAASLFILTGILIRERRFYVLVIHLSFAGMIYIFEVFNLVVFQAYEYSPGIVRDKYLDSMIGSTVSNFMTVPALALLIAYYQLRWKWIFAGAFTLGGVDLLFVHLQIYTHHWWSSSYTVITLLAFFWMCRTWIRSVRHGKTLIPYITFLMYSFCVADSVFFLFLLSGWRRFQLGLYRNPLRDDVMLTVIVAFCVAFILVNAIYWTNKRSYLMMGFTCILIGQYALYRTGHLSLYVSPWLYSTAYAAALLLISFICIAGLRALRGNSRYPDPDQ